MTDALDVLKPSQLELLLFSSKTSLTPQQSRDLLRAPSRHARELVIAKALGEAAKAMRDDRAGQDSLI